MNHPHTPERAGKDTQAQPSTLGASRAVQTQTLRTRGPLAARGKTNLQKPAQMTHGGNTKGETTQGVLGQGVGKKPGIYWGRGNRTQVNQNSSRQQAFNTPLKRYKEKIFSKHYSKTRERTKTHNSSRGEKKRLWGPAPISISISISLP